MMASGWAPDGAVQDQIDDSISDAVRLARSRLPSGPGEINCQSCSEEIPEARRQAMPGVRTCVDCQSARDAPASVSAYNRRGSKDSQLTSGVSALPRDIISKGIRGDAT